MRRMQPPLAMAALLLITVIAILIAGLTKVDGEEDVQRCVSFVLQRQGADCSCSSVGEECTCVVNERRRTAHPCSLAFSLSTSRQSRPQPSRISQVNAISGRQADEDLRPIDLRPRHLLLGTLAGDEEPFYHMSILPRSLDQLGTRFFLYFSFLPTEQNELLYNDTSTIERFFNFAFEKVFVIAHDQNEARVTRDVFYKELKTRLFAIQRSSAVILVDWAVGAQGQTVGNSFDDQAAANTIVVGREVALICYQLANRAIIADEDFYFIGNGLGAQMLHFATEYYTQIWRTFGLNNGNPVGLEGPQHKIGRFTALDPTAKHFQGYLSNTLAVPHVNRWDATSVDVIHTSCVRGPRSGFDREDIEAERIGMSIPAGAADFYPNGCSGNHPNCEGNVPGILRVRCNHKMALNFFIATISANSTVENYMNSYVTTQWDDRKSVERRSDAQKLPKNIMGFKALSGFEKVGIFTLPLALVLRDFSFAIDEPRTDAIKFRLDSRNFRVQRVVHPKYRLPGIDSGQLIDDFPPQKPQGLISLDDRELRSCGQFRPPVRSVPSPRVIEGHLPFVGQFPWVVCLIGLGYEGDPVWTRQCTGSLLNSRFALFAAHCFKGPRLPGIPDPNYRGFVPDDWLYYVTFGTNDCMQPNGNYRKVVFNRKDIVFIPEQYNPFAPLVLWDIALVKLHQAIELPETYNGGNVNSICWRSATLFDYGDTATDLYIAGFGTKSFNVSLDNDRLTWITYRTVQPDYSSYTGGILHKLTNEAWTGTFHLKTFDRNTLRAIGPGDSGAPFVWYIRTADEPEVDASSNVSIYRGVLAGVVSNAVTDFNNPEVDQDGRIAVPISGTKTGSPVFEWIVKTMDDKDNVLKNEPEQHFLIYRVDPPTFVTAGQG